ncbi:hypothetical protein [Nonomuraea bangladeshensis]|uniref:hypothetical protein n=1 Tax=Nonomuraea bangladeshensis TaxID=404385 RepID=UPI0031CF9F3D
MIKQMLHSPSRTRYLASCLIGRKGIVVGLLRDGTLALVELDGDADEAPYGVRRWAVHLDDLEIYDDAAPPKQPERHRLGITESGSEVVHAVPADSTDSLCGEAAKPLPVLGWSMPFAPTASRACPECVHELEQLAQLVAGASHDHFSPRPRYTG